MKWKLMRNGYTVHTVCLFKETIQHDIAQAGDVQPSYSTKIMQHDISQAGDI